MINLWTLPETVEFGGIEYHMNTDFRDVLEIMEYLADEASPDYVKWEVSLSLFYEEEIPQRYKGDAMKYLSEFIAYGDDGRHIRRKTIDWNQDATMIIADVNKVAGFDIRAKEHIHWWTFLAYFNGIGEGQLSTVVSIRDKKAKGKKLEKWEEEYYTENRRIVDFKPKVADKETLEYFNKWL